MSSEDPPAAREKPEGFRGHLTGFYRGMLAVVVTRIAQNALQNVTGGAKA